MRLDDFYGMMRSDIALTEENVYGFDRCIEYGMERGTDVEDLAYILATAYWETGRTMHPVREAYWLSEGWRKRNLRYYPWYGRGLIQVTWKTNYEKMGRELGDVNMFTADPNKMLEWKYALPCLFVGMEKGLYTGKDLDDYLPGNNQAEFEHYKRARRIVNGTDKASTIARIAVKIENSLRYAGYKPGDKVVDPIVSHVLKRGDKGEKVRELQELLGEYYLGKVDGDFGSLTEVAVESFQKSLFTRGEVNEWLLQILRERKRDNETA